MDSYEIFRQAENLVQRYGTRDAVRIAEEDGMWVHHDPLGNLLGMYTYQLRHRIILLNSSLDENNRQMVCGHEIGHDKRHRSLSGAKGFQEFTLFNMTGKTEYEANAFASHLLLDNDEVLAYAKDGYDVCQIAQAMNTNINLMLIKLQEMQKLGSKLTVPMQPDGRFMAKLRCTEPAY